MVHTHRKTSKAQRRHDHIQVKAQTERSCTERSAEIAEHKLLDHKVAKGRSGFAKTMVSLLKNPASFTARTGS